jgi:hypothetical protein
MSDIGTLNEQPLHAALKAWYAMPGDQIEVPLDGYVIDIVRSTVGDTKAATISAQRVAVTPLLIEIQTANFTAIKRKLAQLVADYRVRLVYPIPREKWIVRQDDTGAIIGRRKSPKRGAVVDIFHELVRIPHVLPHPNLTLDVLLIQEDEIRRYDGRRGWRRKGWVIHERRLLDVVAQRTFVTPADWGALLPDDLSDPFTTADLARGIQRPRRLAQQMAYTLRKISAIQVAGKRGNAILYTRG